MTGIVYYGEKDTFLPGPLAWVGKKKAVDDRDSSDAMSECVSKFNKKAVKTKDANFTVDASGFNCNDVKVFKYGKYYTHHITVQNLDAEKEYFFRVGDGIVSYGKSYGGTFAEREMPAISEFKSKTLPVITKVETPNPAYGTSYNVYYREDGTMGDKKNFDSIIFLKTFKDGMEYITMSSVTNSDGGWTIDLANVRDSDGTVVPMKGVSLEFIPQVDNAKPGASGTTLYEETEFPLKLMGNSEDDWGKREEEISGLDLNVLKQIIMRTSAYDNYDPALQFTTCWGVVDNSYCKSLSTITGCSGNYPYASQSACEKAIPSNGENASNNKTCCFVTADSCSCVTNQKSCSSPYNKEYANKDACEDQRIPKNCCSYNAEENSCTCNLNCTAGNTLTQASCQQKITEAKEKQGLLKRCEYDGKNDGKGIDREGPIRGGCSGGYSKCFYRYYHADRGETCQWMPVDNINCPTKSCTDDGTVGQINWGELCTQSAGCLCGRTVIKATFNSKCESRDNKKTSISDLNTTCVDPDGCICQNQKNNENISAGFSCLTFEEKGVCLSCRINSKCYNAFSKEICDKYRGSCDTESICSDGKTLDSEIEYEEKKGYTFVPAKIDGTVSNVYIPNDIYKQWVDDCIDGKQTTIQYATSDNPNLLLNGTPDCPKMEFDYLAGHDIRDKELYNYDLLNSFFGKLSFGAAASTLARLITSTGAVSVETALATVGSTASASSSTAAAAALANAMAGEGVVINSSNLINVLISRLSQLSVSEMGPRASQMVATAIASKYTSPAIAGLLPPSSGVAGLLPPPAGPLATVPGGTTTLAATGGSAGTTTLSWGTMGAIAGGVALAAFYTDLSLSRENVYEQCATVINGDVVYSIQPKYCNENTVQTGITMKSTPCACNGVRTELTKSTIPVFDVKFYLNPEDEKLTACVGSNCNSTGTEVYALDKTPIKNSDGKSIVCCDGEPKMIEECCSGRGIGSGWAAQYCVSPWGDCFKVDGSIPIINSISFSSQDEFAKQQEETNENILDMEFHKKSYASEEDTTQKFLFSDSGLYKVNVIGGNSGLVMKEANTSLIYYIERNGISGYQSPENPYNPKEGEDIAVTESSVVMSVSKESMLQKHSLKKGINIISFNFMPTLGESAGKLTSVSFLEIANAGHNDNISSISYFSGGQWNGGTSYDFEKRETKGVPFDLVPGKGYVVVAERDTTISVPGYEIKESVPVAFSRGWNLVGIHGYSTAYTARTLIESINTIEGLKSDNVTWWPTSRGMYQGYQLINGQSYGQDYPISPLNGYFVRISEFNPKDPSCKTLWWNPGGNYNGQCDK
jgi:hypothetical protein